MEREIIKEYQKDELTIVWKPKLCIHAAECVKKLPGVYKPTEKPWIQPENATKEQLIEQIKLCPSGALTYKLPSEMTNENESTNTRIEIMAKGPMIVHGDVCIVNPDGSETTKEKRVALCRCGASQNKPFCDGKHKGIEFDV